MNTVIKAPVLLLAFNRPAKTQEVFECIRRAKPQKLYVAVDAPRENRPDDVENCNQVKVIVKNVDWPCETHYLFHEKNQGCTMAGKKAWDWLFSQEEEMIFLEDDGVVTDSFFVYCQELLEKYRNDERIAYIGGVNFGQKYGDATSYFFTRYSVSTYGMATWKRVYDLYDYDLDTYPTTRNTRDFRSQFFSRFERDVFLDMFDTYRDSVIKGNRINTYDRQMNYLVCKYHKWCIYPNLNQVTNIGFDWEASNTSIDPNSDYAKAHVRPRYEFEEIIHPKTVSITMEHERELFKVRLLGGEPIWKAMTKFYIEKLLRR